MIHRITSSAETFKTVEFTPGLNTILAERTATSRATDSRNGAGKSLLVEIIHFCLGADFRGSALDVEPLAGWTFSLEMDLADQRRTVTRSTGTPGRCEVAGDATRWPIKPRQDDAGHFYFSLEEWRDILGELLFAAPRKAAGEKYYPTFRSLFSYFARRGRTGFATPF